LYLDRLSGYDLIRLANTAFTMTQSDIWISLNNLESLLTSEDEENELGTKLMDIEPLGVSLQLKGPEGPQHPIEPVESIQIFRSFNEHISLTIHTAPSQTSRSNGRILLRFSRKTARLIPLYALPVKQRISQGFDVEILLGPMILVQLIFRTLKEALRFQHAFTGYKVFANYSQGSIQATVVPKRGEIEKRVAVVQMWIPKELEGKSPTIERSNAESTLNCATGSGNWGFLSPRDPVRLKRSTRSTDSSEPAISEGYSTNNEDTPAYYQTRIPPSSFHSAEGDVSPCSAPSIRVNGAIPRRSTTTSSGAISPTTRSPVPPHRATLHGTVFSKPKRRLLVLFLRDPSATPDTYSFMSLEIDEQTESKPAKCQCVDKEHDCHHLVIKKKGGKMLQAQVFAGKTLSDLDVNCIVVEKKHTWPRKIIKLKRISLIFEGTKEREGFGGIRCKCSPTTHGEFHECMKKNHQGVFGKVKEESRRAFDGWKPRLLK
jgi:hypothetical protein